MTRYEEMSAKAAAWSKRYYENQRDCQQFAAVIMNRYTAYLGAPDDAVQFVGLTSDFKFTNDLLSPGVPPQLLGGEKGELIFALSTRMKNHGMFGARDRCHVGLTQRPKTWEVSWNHAPRITVPKDDLSKLDDIFEEELRNSTRAFEANVSGVNAPMGFMPLAE